MRKKVEKSSPHPLAPGGPFWYIIRPLRPKGAHSLIETRTVLKKNAIPVPPEGGTFGRDAEHNEHGKLVVMPGAPRGAPRTMNKFFF